MALSRELTRRLETNEEPLAKRLKLAENTFTSEDFPATRKEDLVLRWLCEQIQKDEKNSAAALSTLAKCLKFKNSSPAVILKTDVKQILVDTLEAKLAGAQKVDLADVVESCETIFSSREMFRYFETNVASLARLIGSLVDCIHDQKAENGVNDDESPCRQKARNCVIEGIECLVTCYKQSANKDEIAETLTSQILYPLCSLVEVNRSDKLGAEIHKCIQQVIFGKARYLQFKDFDGKDANHFAAKLFGALRKKAKTCEENVTVVAFLYIFRAASGSYKNDPATIDRVFRKLMNSAGPAKVKVLSTIGQLLANVGFDYQNKIEESTLFEYFQEFIDEIISTEEINASHYEALETIAILNPLIVETKMQNILKRILLREKKNAGEIDSYRKLMVAIVQAGVRLRREQKLIPWILKAMEEELESSENSKFDVAAIFPVDFKMQFSQSVSNMTSMQTIGILRTLNFHLNNCVESVVKNKKTGTVMLQATVDLMSAYFEGVRIFDHSIPVSGQDKFVQGLKDLGKTISLLTENVMKIKGNKKMITAVLTAVLYWDNMHTWMKYYVPEAVPQELDFPISESQVQEIMENIDNSSCRNAMNRILVQKIGRNLETENSSTLSKLLGGLENSWSIILDQSPQILATMDNSQIAESAKLLLQDLKSSSIENSQSMKRLNVESVQNDERFLKALVYQILVDISEGINDSTTKTISGHVNPVKLLNRGSLSKLTNQMKNDLTTKEWQTLDEESTLVVEKDLEILLQLPLMYLGLDVRTIILLVVYSIKNECKGNEKILQICAEVTMDLSEKFDIDVMDVLDPDSLIRELTHDKSFQRVIESSLRNVSDWETLKSLIKKCRAGDDSAALLLECIERVKPKLKSEEKGIFKKAEQKLCKKLQENFGDALSDHNDIRRLTLALAVATTHEEIPEILLATAKSTLISIFETPGEKREELVADGLRLVNVVLKLRGKLEFNDEIVNNVWPHVLHNPVKEMALRLLERTEPKALQKLFASLHSQTIAALGESDEVSFKRCLIVWDCVTSIQMGGPRQKLRTAALHDFLQALQISPIPANFWPHVLKFVYSTLPESLHVLEKSIDVVSLLADRSLNEAELIACENALVLCSSLVKFNAPLITDRLPILLGLYRKIVRIVVRESRKENDPSRLRILGCLAIDIEKLTNSLVKLKKDLTRISPYVIADLVGIFSEGVIPPKVKGPLEDSVAHFLSISDHHAISLLSRTLPTSTRAIFQTLYETYNKFHKFTGKI